MIDDNYLRQRFGDLPRKYLDSLRRAMEPYGDNRWWESEDPVEIARHQVFEDVKMSDLDTYHEGIQILTGRPVFRHELLFNIEGLREEVTFGLRRLEKGLGISQEYRETALRRSIEMLERIARENGKTFLKFDLPEEQMDEKEGDIDRSGYDGFLG